MNSIYKVISANYDEITGISIVKVKSPYDDNIYTGVAHLNHEEDFLYASSFFGCELAENRAIINCIKAYNKQLQKRLWDYLNKNITEATDKTPDPRIIKPDPRIIKYYINTIRSNKKRIISIYKNIQNSPIKRIETIKKIHNTSSKEENQRI